MATMVKEKRREKKKTKTIQLPEKEPNIKQKQDYSLLGENCSKENDIPSLYVSQEASTSTVRVEQPSSTVCTTQDTSSIVEQREKQLSSGDKIKEKPIPSSLLEPEASQIASELSYINLTEVNKQCEQDHTIEINEVQTILTEAKRRLEEIRSDAIPETELQADTVMPNDVNKIQEVTLNNFELELTTLDSNSLDDLVSQQIAEVIIVPSAPLGPMQIEVQPYVGSDPCENVLERARIPCMPLEEAVRVFGGKEITEVKVLSKKEEAIVEAGPQSGPDHPLVDLLSTFRTSLIAIERERNRISSGYTSEEKSRATLWRVEKRSVNVTQQCRCGADVALRAGYEVAWLQTERMPAARLRLESLLRDVRECYCHHQHAALQAHYDVDELVAQILRSGKGAVREALLLVLQALQLSDAAPGAFAAALQRWVTILASCLLDNRDLGHLLFLLHSLFRQTRSVQWAGRVIELQVSDAPAAARLVAVLELLLTRPLLEEALECTEESEAWEEVDDRGEGGAVGEGRLRERDLLVLLDALPLQDMVAKMLLFTRSDIAKEDEHSWGDKSGGRGVLRASCGVRALLGVLQRALAAHAGYARLRARLRHLATAALAALASLHLHCKDTYDQELEERIAAECQACFAGGLAVLPQHAPALPAALLSPDVAAHYCRTLIAGLHEPRPLRVECLSAVLEPQACSLRVRAAAQAALDRELDGELAWTVLDFLFQVGIKRKSAACKGSCDATAREMLPQLLIQRRLHAAAFHMLAELSQVETIDPSLLQCLAPQQWRPTPAEAWALLDEWAARCSQLVQHLLLNLDYTPHTGVSLESQLSIGSWVCAWARARGAAPEWAWQLLRALAPHRTQWGLPLDAPPPDRADDPLSAAYALLASDWGHCLPLVCGPGVEALARLAAARPADAARCAARLMRVMAQSPESVALTPKFAEVFTAILNSGPSLVQRALGRRAPTGHEILQQLLMEQVQDARIAQRERSALLSAWLHALWRPAVPASARAALDAAVRACRDWSTLDAHTAALLQEENAKEYINDAVRNVAQAPLLCESILRNSHAIEVQTQTYARLMTELAAQHAAGQRIHVDNALRQMGLSITDDELTIHRCACAGLWAPLQHPAHLLLWRLLLHMWLQRAPLASPESPPVGPLFFSGLVKSRTLAQLKRRLQETATYHRAQIEVLKTTEANIASPSTPRSSVEKNTNPASDNDLFPTLAILDLTGASDSDSDESLSDRDIDNTAARGSRETSVDRDTHDLICYHTAAEKVVREYLVWLEEGARVRASAHHADIARFLSEQALDSAWRASLSTLSTPADTPTSPVSAPPPPPPPAPAPHTTHCERAVRAILDIGRNKRRRYKLPDLPAVKDEAYFRDTQLVVGTIQTQLAELEKLTREWESEVERVSKLDAQLWELVGRLRVRRPLPPVQKACPQGCKPVTIHIAKDEWCISSGAEQGIQENRRRARAAIRQLSRPRPHVARITSRMQSIARRIRSQATALRVAEVAAGAAPRTEPCAPAHDAVTALVADIAARFISADAKLATQYLKRWSAGSAQQKLCLVLVDPARLVAREWPALYTAILDLKLPPHVAFSYISKFDLSVWADAVGTEQRSEVLEALVKAAQRLGPQPDDQHLMLLELLGVHSSTAARAPELCAHTLRCAHACLSCALPPLYLKHLPGVVDKYGGGLDFDQLGHLLRQLGVIFWRARGSSPPSRLPQFAAYAPHFADTLHALLREFVAAAVGRTYGPERVAVYAWSGACEAWSAWAAPHASAPLLPCAADAEGCTDMLARFGDSIDMIMRDCPGSEDVLLRQVFRWTVQTYLGAEPRWAQEALVAASALLARLAALPWRRQWFHVEILPLCVQMSRSTERELASWCSSCLQHLHTESWLQGAADEQLAPTLTDLLEVFTSKQLSLPCETLERACALPWARVPELALSHALERYFADHHSAALPYHRAPQFRVMLSACFLIPHEEARAMRAPQAAEKRAHAVSQWVRAATAPALAAHVREHSAYLLDTLTNLAPHIEESTGELEQLLGRAVIILCMEPAATVALPVWVGWVSSCPPRLRHAAASAAATLTTLDYFAALGDAAAKAILNEKDSAGWGAVWSRWPQCAWWEGGSLVSRGGLHAAYAMLHARTHSRALLRQAFSALLAADINFANNETMVAVWVSVAARTGAGGAGDECGAAARALLARWAERRRTLLQVVTLHSADNCPTTEHRLLCRLALCVVSPSEANAKAYESACGPLLGNSDAVTWGRSPHPSMVPRLAARLYPQHEVYFKEELELTASLV